MHSYKLLLLRFIKKAAPKHRFSRTTTSEKKQRIHYPSAVKGVSNRRVVRVVKELSKQAKCAYRQTACLHKQNHWLKPRRSRRLTIPESFNNPHPGTLFEPNCETKTKLNAFETCLMSLTNKLRRWFKLSLKFRENLTNCESVNLRVKSCQVVKFYKILRKGWLQKVIGYVVSWKLMSMTSMWNVHSIGELIYQK